MKHYQLVSFFEWMTHKMAEDLAREIDELLLKELLKKLDENNSL